MEGIVSDQAHQAHFVGVPEPGNSNWAVEPRCCILPKMAAGLANGRFATGGLGVALGLVLAAAAGASVAGVGPKGVLVAAALSALALATLEFGVAPLAAAAFAAAIGAVPGLSNRQPLMAGVDAGDLATAALIALFVLVNAQSGFVALRGPRLKWVTWLSAIFAIYLALQILRTTAEGTPMSQALRIGRDFVYFPLLVPLSMGALAVPSFRRRFLFLVVTTAVVSTATYVLASVGPQNLANSIVNVAQETSSSGFRRLYTDTADLIQAALAFGFCYLLQRRYGLKWLAALILVALGIAALALFQTRARVATLPLGIFLALVISAGSPKMVGRLFVVLALFLTASAVIKATVHVPALDQAASSISTRLLSPTGTAGNENSDTLGYRAEIAGRMTGRLSEDGAWVAGLGLLSPTSKPDASLPKGAIRNPDVGVLNVVMTLGLIGALLFYGVVAAAILLVVKAARTEGRDRWQAVGALAYSIAAVLSSVTLVTLFSVSGVVTSAVVLAIGASVLDLGRMNQPRPVSSQ